MKIVTVVGARPQFVKAATLSRELRENHPGVTARLIHTGQHYDADMSAAFFEELDIPDPEFNLGIGGGSHGRNTGRMLEAIEEVLLAERPDWVVVYGDTDSTLAGALAAVKLHIPTAHVEAGLRSFNRAMPEEINRILTDHAADLLFAPTDVAVANLIREGVTEGMIHQVGDVMYDAALYYGDWAQGSSRILERLNLVSQSYILATLHRAENTDDAARMAAILAGFSTSPRPIVLPLHPRTRKRLQEHGLDMPQTVRLIDPVGYLDMVMLERHAALIATDSGGVQKEAYFHRVPCLTLRDETEWVELVEAGINQLAGADTKAVRVGLECSVEDGIDFPEGLYGQGDAARRIARILTTNG